MKRVFLSLALCAGFCLSCDSSDDNDNSNQTEENDDLDLNDDDDQTPDDTDDTDNNDKDPNEGLPVEVALLKNINGTFSSAVDGFVKDGALLANSIVDNCGNSAVSLEGLREVFKQANQKLQILFCWKMGASIRKRRSISS